MINTTLRLDPDTHDLVITDGELQLIHGDDTVTQCVRNVLLTWLGEWDYDLSVGTDYSAIIADSTPSDTEIIRIITSAIYQEPDVKHVDSVAVNRAGRTIQVTFTASLANGAVIRSEVSTGG